MRRNLVSQFNPVILRKGVTDSEISRKTSVRIPVVRVTNSKGFAPTCLRYQSQSRSVNGTRALTKRTSLAKRVSFITDQPIWSAVASVARHRFGSDGAWLSQVSKAPSALRSAGALQI